METNIVLPAVVTITNTSDKVISFIPYRENFQVPMDPGDVIKIEALTSGQVFYYLGQEVLPRENGLKVDQGPKA